MRISPLNATKIPYSTSCSRSLRLTSKTAARGGHKVSVDAISADCAMKQAHTRELHNVRAARHARKGKQVRCRRFHWQTNVAALRHPIHSILFSRIAYDRCLALVVVSLGHELAIRRALDLAFACSAIQVSMASYAGFRIQKHRPEGILEGNP